jgi:hypothetical protein
MGGKFGFKVFSFKLKYYIAGQCCHYEDPFFSCEGSPKAFDIP